jgi:hypothetical protein
MALFPLIAFWLLIYFGRNELQSKTIRIFVAIWLVSLGIIILTGLHPGFFTAIQAMLDAILIIIIFGGDIQIR